MAWKGTIDLATAQYIFPEARITPLEDDQGRIIGYSARTLIAGETMTDGRLKNLCRRWSEATAKDLKTAIAIIEKYGIEPEENEEGAIEYC